LVGQKSRSSLPAQSTRLIREFTGGAGLSAFLKIWKESRRSEGGGRRRGGKSWGSSGETEPNNSRGGCTWAGLKKTGKEREKL